MQSIDLFFCEMTAIESSASLDFIYWPFDGLYDAKYVASVSVSMTCLLIILMLELERTVHETKVIEITINTFPVNA